MTNAEFDHDAEARLRVAYAIDTCATSLDLSGLQIDHLPGGIRHLPALTSLNLSGCEQVSDLTPIQALTALTSLNLILCKRVSDLTPIQTLTALKTLIIRGCWRVSDFTPIQALTRLTSLDLSFCEQVSDLRPIQALTRLTSLKLEFCEQISDLRPIQALTTLTSLELNNCKQVSDLRPIQALTTLTSLSLGGCEQINDLTPIRALTALTFLDLSFCTQVSDLKPIQALTALTSLHFSYCMQVSDLKPIQALTALTSLHFGGCEQVSDLKPIQALTALTSLHFGGCEQVSDLKLVQALTALTSLDFGYCEQVSDLTPIQALTALTSLDLSGCGQVSDLTPIQALTALTSLKLSRCGQVSDLTPIQALTALTSLDLSRCGKVSDLTPIQALTALTSLDLSRCGKVSDLTPIQALTALTSLDLSGCGQVSDLTPIQALTALTSLNLSYCVQVSDLTPIQALTALTSLKFSGCEQVSNLMPLKALSSLRELKLRNHKGLLSFDPLVPLLPFLDELDLQGSIFAHLDPAISGSSENVLTRVRAHFEDLHAGHVVDRESKLVLLGNGGAGKTQLGLKLRKEPFEPGGPSTHGIQVHQTQIDVDDGEAPVDLNIWDFGGQEIYHGSHSLFLQGRAIFMVLWTPKLEKTESYQEDGVTMRHRHLPYWLDYIRAFSGPSDPVIIVQSKCDTKSQRVPKPPVTNAEDLSLPFVQTSALTAYQFEDLRSDLKRTLRHSFDERDASLIGKGRAKAREHIRNLPGEGGKKLRLLERAHFDLICDEAGDITDKEAFLDFLHHSGAVFYRPDLFEGRIILDQNWAFNAVYTLFDRKKALHVLLELKGRFTRLTLESLAWRAYTLEEQELFLTFMQSCGICFRVAGRFGEESEYIAPELLPSRKEADKIFDLAFLIPEYEPAAEANARYGFLHEGILRNYISKIGEYAGGAPKYWKYGCWFAEQTTKSRVLIETHWENKEQEAGPGSIVFRAWGERAQDLIEPLLCELDRLQIGQKPEIEWQRKPPPAHREQSGKKNSGLGGLVIPEHATKISDAPKIFVSSFWRGDSSEQIKLQTRETNQLLEAARREGWAIVRDAGAPSDEELVLAFMNLVGPTDLIFIILSYQYLRSIRCMTELSWIYMQARLGGRPFARRIVPLFFENGKIESPEDRGAIDTHWLSEYKSMNKNRKYLTGDEPLQYAHLERWFGQVAQILNDLKEHLHPQPVLGLLDNDYEALKILLEEKRRDLLTASPQTALDRMAIAARLEVSTENFIKWAGGDHATLTIVFTDVVGSTALGQELGDSKMNAVRLAHFAKSRSLIENLRGREIKTIGDSFMAAFKSADAALNYARALYDDTGDPHVRIRAGIHTGSMFVEPKDVFGGTVNFAARVVGAIKDAEIWVSDVVKNALGHVEGCTWERHSDMVLKGFEPATVTLWSLRTKVPS